MLGEAREALIEADAGRPLEHLADPTLVEPVRCRQLAGQESGHRRIIRPAPDPPQALSDSTAGPRDRAGHGAGGGLDPARGADPLDQLGHRARLAVGDHERLPVAVLRMVESGHHRVHGVVDVRGVDQGPPAAHEGQPAGPGTIDDPPDQLRVARAPDQVRTDRDRREPGAISGQDIELGLGLAPGVVALGAARIGRVRARAREGRAGVCDRRRRDEDEPGDPVAPARHRAPCGYRTRWPRGTAMRCRPRPRARPGGSPPRRPPWPDRPPQRR